MSFRASVESDIKSVFLNTGEFADKRTVKYNGVDYKDIPIVLSNLKEKDRRTIIAPNSPEQRVRGLFLVSATLHCALSDLRGVKPEKGQRIKINDKKGGGGFFQEFYVTASGCEMGMLRVELEAVDE